MHISSMEPMLPSGSHSELDDLVIDLVAKANHLAGQIRPEVQESIGELVRSMNCYYSNLIEGHDTHPREINRALADNYSQDPKKRALQKEARAHIELQRMIDLGDDPVESPTSAKYIKWLHHEFCSRLPDELLWVENQDTGEKIKVVPGELRTGDVIVGEHVPPPAPDLPSFLDRIEQVYDSESLSKQQYVISIAASHHRFLWVHPFYDGNGRVARLVTHKMCIHAGFGNCMWSIARGLARESANYKSKLMAADQARKDSYDGRGALSQQELVEFCRFFLTTSIDQVDFMESLLQPQELLRRMRRYCEDEIDADRLPPKSMSLLREALQNGEFERGRASEITGYQERRARQILSTLLSKGLLVSTGPRAPVRLGFPLEVVERWFPALYPTE